MGGGMERGHGPRTPPPFNFFKNVQFVFSLLPDSSTQHSQPRLLHKHSSQHSQAKHFYKSLTVNKRPCGYSIFFDAAVVPNVPPSTRPREDGKNKNRIVVRSIVSWVSSSQNFLFFFQTFVTSSGGLSPRTSPQQQKTKSPHRRRAPWMTVSPSWIECTS